MNLFNEAIRLALYELNWSINQARDNEGEEAAKATYLKFGTIFSRDPFLMAQLAEQERVKEFLLDPDNAADAKTLFELTITLRTQMESIETDSWLKLGEIFASSIDGIKESELVTPTAAERIQGYFTHHIVFQTMVIIYYAVREFNMLQTGAMSHEAVPERTR